MKFELDHRTGMMRPKKDEEIYFAQSQGGGLIVDDKKNNIKYVIQRDGRITKLFGSFDKDNLNLYDMRDARIIADRVRRLLGVDHKYTDFHYFLRGYHMSESFIKTCSDFLGESIWSDIQDRSGGETIRREDDISRLDNEGLYDYIKSKYESRIPEFNIGMGYYTKKSSNEKDLLIQPYGRWKPLMFYVFYNDGKIVEIHAHFDKFKRWNFNILKQKYLLIPEKYQDEGNYNFKISEKDGTITNHTVIGIIDILVEDKSKILLESIWSDIQDRSGGETIKKEEGRIIGTLEDGTRLIMSNDAFADGNLVDFDGENFYTLSESSDGNVYIAVINEGNTDVYYKYDEDSEDVVNMVRCFDADESLRTNNDFGMLRALMNQDEWDNSCIDDLEVSIEGNHVKFEFSGFEFVIYDDIDKAKDDAVEDAINIEKESLKVFKNELNQKYISSTELEKIRQQFHEFIDNIRNNCGNDGFDEDELKDTFEESFEFDYDEFDEEDAINALLSNEIIEDTEEYFDLDEDGEIDHTLPKFDYQDYKDKYVEKSMENLDDYIDAYISQFGYDGIEEYIDFDKVGEKYVDNEGPAHWLAYEDHMDREQRIDDVTYYIYRRS